MESLTEKICPYCKTEIKEGEESKTCPACGIPHHLGCWEENNGCTTFGCFEKHVESQESNSGTVCSGCGNNLGEDQMFCPKCGTQKNRAVPKFCHNCGAEISEDQAFCAKCGAKLGVTSGITVDSAINAYNAGIEKKKKKAKVLPAVLAAVFVFLSIGGIFTYTFIREKKMKEAIEVYESNAYLFYLKVINSGSKMESIGNEIQKSWRAFVYSSTYNGSRYYTVDSAIDAALIYSKSDIIAVDDNKSAIEELYWDLMDVPDLDDDKLMDIRDAVEEVYDAYTDMYDCVITPSGNYTSWTSKFSSVDSELADAIGDLGDLLKAK